MEKHLLEVEDASKNTKKEESAILKQLNTTTQKVDNCVSKLAAVETRLAKLEKKWYLDAGSVHEFEGAPYANSKGYSSSTKSTSLLKSNRKDRRGNLIYLWLEDPKFFIRLQFYGELESYISSLKKYHYGLPLCLW